MIYVKRLWAMVAILGIVGFSTWLFVFCEVFTGKIDKGLISWNPSEWDW